MKSESAMIIQFVTMLVAMSCDPMCWDKYWKG